MSRKTKNRLGAVAALAAATAIIAPAAYAGCGVSDLKAPAAWRSASVDSANPALMRVDMRDVSIVGLWDTSFYVGATRIDFGYQQWHGDGTELLNSGSRAPSTQNFCMGVWSRNSLYGYHLNHFALAYDPAAVTKANPSGFVARVNIKEDVTLDPTGSSFGGTFTIDAYNPVNGALINHVGGRVTGRRITAN
jgi:hypothetical protein